MSPETARALKVGDMVAWRGEPDLRRFSHVKRISRVTKRGFHLTGTKTKLRPKTIPYENRSALANLRRAGTDEIHGFIKWQM